MASIGDFKVIVISLTVIVIIGINSYFVDAARKGSKRTKGQYDLHCSKLLLQIYWILVMIVR